MKTIRSLICVGVGVLASALNVHAAPYASGCTNVGGVGGVVTYYLNATPASGAVTITTYPSLAHPANTPATPAQGANSFTLPGGDSAYTISVATTGTGTPSAESIATANSPQTAWGGQPDPRGMDVNCYPTNGAAFGSVYMANGAAYSVSGNNKSKGKGILPCHSDLSYAFGATTAGLATADFTSSGSGSGPFHMNVSRYDGSVMADDLTVATGTVWLFDPFVTNNGTRVLTTGLNTTGAVTTPPTNHGGLVGTPRSTGTIAGGNFVLYTGDWNMPAPSSGTAYGGVAGGIGINSSYFNSYYKSTIVTAAGVACNIYRYTINGSSLPYTTMPDLSLNVGINFAGVFCDVDINPTNGYIYTTSGRAGVGSAPWLAVYDSTGATNLYCSAQSATVDNIVTKLANFDSGADIENVSLRVSPDGKYIALAGYYGYIAIFNLTNGIPDLSTYVLISPEIGVTYSRGVAWDAADNVYMLNSGEGLLYIYDLGNTEVCTTSNDVTGLNGSFTLTGPPTASVSATTPLAYQAGDSYAIANSLPGQPGSVTGQFTITLSYAPASPTAVKFTMGGTATNLTTYTLTSSAGTSQLATSPYSVTFPAGVTTETVTVTPGASPAVGPTLTAILTETTGNGYGLASPTAATVSIANAGAQTLFISGTGAATMYRGLTNDFVSYILTRWGDTNAAYTLLSSSFSVTGTAAYLTDYAAGPQPVNFINNPVAGTGVNVPVGAGDLIETIEVGLPLSHGSYTGNQTLILNGTGGTSPEGTNYTISAATATATLLDNLNPPEIVLWSDPLTDAADSTNWNVAFSSDVSNYVVMGVGPNQYSYFTNNYNGVPQVGGTNLDFDAIFGYSPDGSGNVTGGTYGVTWDYVSPPPYVPTNSALRVTVNKLNSGGAVAAGVNLYPNNAPTFSGNFAMRFSMNLVHGCGSASATEYACFGINHLGSNNDWWLGSPILGSGTQAFSFTNADGIWYAVASDPAGAGAVGGFAADFQEFTAENVSTVGAYPSTGFLTLNGSAWSSYTNVFKNPVDYSAGSIYLFPYTTAPYNTQGNTVGSPANVSGWYQDAYSSAACNPNAPYNAVPPGVGPWTDVSIEQSNSTVRMYLNKTLMFTYAEPAASTFTFTNGTVMLGYFDPFNSEGTGGGVYYSDLRVIDLGPQIVTQPVGATIGAGSNYTFTVKAVVGATGTYTNTWYQGVTQVQQDTGSSVDDIDTLNIVGATDTQVAGTYPYTVVITDSSGGVVTSTTVNLIVQTKPAISVAPVTAYYGSTVTFTATTVSGTTPFTYSWISNATTVANGNGYAGATTASLTISNITLASATTYSAKATNIAGSDTEGALLTVLASPQPNITNAVKSGNTVTLKWDNGGDSANTTNSFTMQGSTNLPVNYVTNGDGVDQKIWTNVTPTPTFTLSGTNFTATFTNNTVPNQYFRIQHK